MRIVIVNRYFYPDESATSRMVASLACGLAARGVEVTALTGRRRHDDARIRMPAHETVDGVTVRRIWTSGFGRDNLIGRAVDYVTFHLVAAIHLLVLLRRGDACIVCTDPPLFSVTAMLPTMLRRAFLVNWVMDLFPEVATDLGLLKDAGWSTRMAMLLRDMSLRHAQCNVALTTRMAQYLVQRGISLSQVAIVNHWSDGEAIKPVPRAENPLRKAWGLEKNFVVGYSGNLGRAHEFWTILDAAAQLVERREIIFLFVGNGHRRAEVEQEAKRRGLSNVVFKPPQPREILSETLSVADVHLVSLLPEMEPYIVPSKFYGIAASGRPTLFIGDKKGEIARLVEKGNCGAAVSINDAFSLRNWILKLAEREEERSRMGAAARMLFEISFTQPRGVADWMELLRRFSPSKGSPNLKAAFAPRISERA